MRRAGSTVQFQIAARLVEEAGLGQRVEWVRAGEFPTLRRRYADYPGWKVFKNHTPTPEIRSEFELGEAMGISIHRDPRDVIVSAMEKWSLSYEQLRQAGFLAECIERFDIWSELPRVLVSQYDHMVVDLPGEVARIATHLGIDCDRERSVAIAADYSLDRQKKRIGAMQEDPNLREGFAGDRFDARTMLHTNHIRSGATGSWKSVLTETQVALIEHEARDWLRTHGYELSLGPARRTWLRIKRAGSPPRLGTRIRHAAPHLLPGRRR